MPAARKYSATIGSAKIIIDTTSAAGVASAVNTEITTIAQRQPWIIAEALSTPMKLSSTRKTGRTKPTPIAMTNFKAKSRYTRAVSNVEDCSGAKLVSKMTMLGKMVQPRATPAKNRGTAAERKPRA